MESVEERDAQVLYEDRGMIDLSVNAGSDGMRVVIVTGKFGP